jgi:hypothetical protein
VSEVKKEPRIDQKFFSADSLKVIKLIKKVEITYLYQHQTRVVTCLGLFDLQTSRQVSWANQRQADALNPT